MPTETFLRLSEEKRTRILESAWEEFMRVPYSEASINRIIRNAEIPRGSFYQYFADKEDLFLYLIDQRRLRTMAMFQRELKHTHGDPFAVIVRVYDSFFRADGRPMPEFQRPFSVLWLNTNVDMVRLLFERTGDTPEPHERAMEWIDASLLKWRESEYIEGMISLLMSALGGAVAKTMEKPDERERIRARLERHVEIIKSGAAAEAKGGENQ